MTKNQRMKRMEGSNKERHTEGNDKADLATSKYKNTLRIKR